MTFTMIFKLLTEETCNFELHIFAEFYRGKNSSQQCIFKTLDDILKMDKTLGRREERVLSIYGICE